MPYLLLPTAPSNETGLQFFCDEFRHLVCTPYSKENLHVMAAHLGIKRCWFHRDHYDIPARREAQIKAQCAVVAVKTILEVLYEAGVRVRGKRYPTPLNRYGPRRRGIICVMRKHVAEVGLEETLNEVGEIIPSETTPTSAISQSVVSSAGTTITMPYVTNAWNNTIWYSSDTSISLNEETWLSQNWNQDFEGMPAAPGQME